ncbi:hypothetical protein L596_025676 [Steinernema carpocapsae]|uniref:Uncharacterized protein n=1 Tax=Steinernema carpocapsae TaxID=34508 RepID=A0A4U5M8H7_STECR|nr:hypothetical protein L596_025676 [Steinernema carpocapsae]
METGRISHVCLSSTACLSVQLSTANRSQAPIGPARLHITDQKSLSSPLHICHIPPARLANPARHPSLFSSFLELKISCADKRRRRQQKEDNTLYEVDPKMPEKDFSEYKLLSDNEAFAKARIASKKSFMSK